MYCVKCGVELRQGAERCPLCGLRVYHPELTETPEPAAYPPFVPGESPSRMGLMFVLTALTLIPLLLCPAIDLRISGRIGWSGYAITGIIAGYLCFLLPMWFKKRNPVVFFPTGMAAVVLLVLFICLKTGGHWFMSFAFPILVLLCLILETLIVLIRYTGKRKAHRLAIILGGGFMGIGGLCVLLEALLHIAFRVNMIWWSLIPFTVLFTIGIAMVIVGSIKRLRASFQKHFFL